MEFRIKEARERAGFSQKELAHMIGVAQNTFHGYESGKHDPKSDLLIKIAQACNVTVDFLLGHSDVIEIKNSPSVAEAEPGEDAIKLYNYINQGLVSLGFIREDDDITPQQAEILIGVCRIIQASFDQ